MFIYTDRHNTVTDCGWRCLQDQRGLCTTSEFADAMPSLTLCPALQCNSFNHT